MGNVHIQNLKGEQFDTELLYWDQRHKEFIRMSLSVSSSLTVSLRDMALNPISR